jgi:hypothetical protein
VPHGLGISGSLIASLTPCVDAIRDINTQIGARPYQVMLVWTRWSGGDRGVGVEEAIREELILPTPKLADMASLSRDLSSVGVDEVGSVRISEISARYTEDYLVGRCDDGSAIAEDQNFYWEIRFPRADGCGMRRRFVPKSAPSLEATKFQWTISLLKASEDRMRSGDVRG